MSDPKPDIFGGQFFVRQGGRLREVGPGTPDVTVCRRLRDYNTGIPEGGAVTACAECGCAIVTQGLFPTRPTICLQCAGILPMPFPEEP
jgi:hypothetical protein